MAFNPQEHMMDLKGKAYLQVMWRLVWFRDEHPNWSISTNLLSLDKENQMAIFKAVITDDTGKELSTGYGSESVKDFKDYIEKAETKAVGRALAMLGYGTQFAPDLDEGERIVDSPVTKKHHSPRLTPQEVDMFTTDLLQAGANIKKICEKYKVKNLDELTADQANEIIAIVKGNGNNGNH